MLEKTSEALQRIVAAIRHQEIIAPVADDQQDGAGVTAA